MAGFVVNFRHFTHRNGARNEQLEEGGLELVFAMFHHQEDHKKVECGGGNADGEGEVDWPAGRTGQENHRSRGQNGTQD